MRLSGDYFWQLYRSTFRCFDVPEDLLLREEPVGDVPCCYG